MSPAEARGRVRHEMSLRPGPFAKIAAGVKRYELRLHDEKRRLIRPGDEILFTRTTDGATVLTRVTKLLPFDSFEALYTALPLTECGYTPENVSAADPRDMEAYYPPQKQREYGVLAIGIELVKLDVAGCGCCGLQTRALSETDITALLTLAKGNPLYYKYMKIQPDRDNLRESMAALPPRKTHADKYFFGWFDGERLVAVMDLIARYPDTETAFIGWFIVAAERQGNGLGRGLIEHVLSCLKSEGFIQARLGRIHGNPQSEAFWRKCGFIDAGVTYETDGYTVVVMNKVL